MHRITILSLCLSGAVASSAFAGLIVPISYTGTTGQGTAEGGSYNYLDETSTQLTDGVYGVNNWAADLGNGNAYEWVGWKTVNPSLTFNFASVVTLDKVLIDFERQESGGGIYLPTSVTIGGTVFPLTGTELLADTRGTLEFAGSWTGSSLTVDFTHATSWWLFVDEMKFNAVPEPSTYAGLTALGLLGFGLYRRCTARRD